MVKLRSANFDMEVTFEGQDYYVLCTTYPDGSSVWGTVPTNRKLIDALQRAEIKIGCKAAETTDSEKGRSAGTAQQLRRKFGEAP